MYLGCGLYPVREEWIVLERRVAVELEDVEFGGEDGGDVARLVGVGVCIVTSRQLHVHTNTT